MEPTTQMPRDQGQPKWEGEACAELRGRKAEQVWPLLEDFFGLHKWLPALLTCLPVQGVSGQPGCVRYCAGVKTPVDRESDRPEHWWCKQAAATVHRPKRDDLELLQYRWEYWVQLVHCDHASVAQSRWVQH
ncbi:hypothetical protein ACLB2K_005260 [Fragaria x ananassa]